MPYRFTSREFAFVYPGSDGMHRPVSFSTGKELQNFLSRKTPLHAYYSTAYYSNPGAPMAQKEWLGADLIFDLDADHLPGSEELTYPEQLKVVKDKTQLLLDDFLLGDFGFQKKDMEMFFSGHRGYHIHVRSKDILGLSRQARREIVDHITGRGLDMDVILPHTTMEVDRFQDIIKTVTIPELPPEEEGGWRRRVRKLTKKLMERWSKKDEEDVIEEMQEKHGIGSKTAEGLYETLFKEEKWKRIVEDGVLDVFSEEQRMVNVSSLKKIIKGILEEENVPEIGKEIKGRTDEPVTGDTKRLIRLPMSIHGGSFMTVKKVPLGELSDFVPFEKAFPKDLGKKEYEIEFPDLPNFESIRLGDKELDIEERMRVPDYAAAFFCSKFKAKVL